MSSALPCGPCGITPDQFSALAEALEQTAQALLAFCRARSESGQEPQAAASKTGVTAAASEYRQYRLPPHTVEQEQELLERYEVDSLAAVLNEIHLELYTTIFLMKDCCYGDDEQSYRIHLLGVQLERALKMLRKACSVLSDYIPASERRAATQ